VTIADQLAAIAALGPITVALTQGAKRSGLPSRFAVIAALVLGVADAWLCAWAAWFALSTGRPGETTLVGVLSGLAAAGLWSGGKAVTAG
jgi:hypothetical protein